MSRQINQTFYDELGDRWFEGDDHPIALLRAEARFRNPWIIDLLSNEFPGMCNVVDVGCGGGLTAAPLAARGHRVIGCDLSIGSLKAARSVAKGAVPSYMATDAKSIAIRDGWADAVLCTDLLEHVDDPRAVIHECARLLRPNGLFIFYTFNRTLWSWIVAKKSMDWIFRDAPKNIHLFRMFIKPVEMENYCRMAGLRVESLEGVVPRMDAGILLDLLVRRRVSDRFDFKTSRSLRGAYLGVARKRG